jgi:hypothetical protein
MSQLLRIHLVNQNPRVLHGRRADRHLARPGMTESGREGPLWCERECADLLTAAPARDHREDRKEG